MRVRVNRLLAFALALQECFESDWIYFMNEDRAMKRTISLLVAMIFAGVSGLAAAQATPAQPAKPAAPMAKPAPDKSKAAKSVAKTKKAKAKRTRKAKAA